MSSRSRNINRRSSIQSRRRIYATARPGEGVRRWKSAAVAARARREREGVPVCSHLRSSNSFQAVPMAAPPAFEEEDDGDDSSLMARCEWLVESRLSSHWKPPVLLSSRP